MKIINEQYDSEKEKYDVLEMLKKSEPKECADLTLEFEHKAGWTYIKGKCEHFGFSINYSDVMTDASDLIGFFAEIIHSKEDIAIILDYEGSYPLLYAKNEDENKVRFVFAHDYKLFNEDIFEYYYYDYEIVCDILICKRKLLSEFYNIFRSYTLNYDPESLDNLNSEFNPEKALKYLKEIEKFLQN